jgi:hypothetical protein
VTATTTSAVTCWAAAPVGLLPLLSGPRRRVGVLGRFPTAIYLDAGGEIVALLAHDAVQLPCGLVLPMASRERPLDAVSGPALVGDGAVVVGPLVARVARFVRVTVPSLRPPALGAVQRVDAAVRRVKVNLGLAGDAALDPETAARLTGPHAAHAAAGLVGRGGGLTPAGDDVLAGFLVAAYAYGLTVPGGVQAVVVDPATTTLSAALLRHAARGESIPQLTRLLEALTAAADLGAAHVDATVDGLARIGHSSGIALATGAIAAATTAAVAA